MLRDAIVRIGGRRMLGLAFATSGLFLVVVGFAASPDRFGLDDHSGVPWAMAAGFVLGAATDVYRAQRSRSKVRAVGWAIVVAATGVLVAVLGLALFWTLSPILSPTKLSAGALLVAEAGLFFGGVALYLWAQGSTKERRARALLPGFVGGILAEAGLLRYLPLSQDTGSVFVYGILILTAIGGTWALARRLRRRAKFQTGDLD